MLELKTIRKFMYLWVCRTCINISSRVGRKSLQASWEGWFVLELFPPLIFCIQGSCQHQKKQGPTSKWDPRRSCRSQLLGWEVNRSVSGSLGRFCSFYSAVFPETRLSRLKQFLEASFIWFIVTEPARSHRADLGCRRLAHGLISMQNLLLSPSHCWKMSKHQRLWGTGNAYEENGCSKGGHTVSI